MHKADQKRFRNPNAQKHGVFAATAILPGEDHKEFQKLLCDLLMEWNPNGPTEEEAVLSIAKAIWRKRRVQAFLDIQVAKNRFDPSHKGFVRGASNSGRASKIFSRNGLR